MYSIYILKCSDNTYYTGVTNNVEKRFFEHQNGIHREAYTYTRRPVDLVYTENYDKIEDAIRREKQVKDWSRLKKEKLIRGEFFRNE
jgi:putative endonuclease